MEFDQLRCEGAAWSTPMSGKIDSDIRFFRQGDIGSRLLAFGIDQSPSGEDIHAVFLRETTP
jgi:hypothetical protein